jgi:hypothetical protein
MGQQIKVDDDLKLSAENHFKIKIQKKSGRLKTKPVLHIRGDGSV